MQVGCHISVVLKDQLILKIVYEKNLSLICPIFSAVLLKNYLASLFIRGDVHIQVATQNVKLTF